MKTLFTSEVISKGARSYANPVYLKKLIDAAVSLSNIPIAVHLDHGDTFDDVRGGYDGPIYMEIAPQTFSVLVRSGTRLNQLRLKRGEPAKLLTAGVAPAVLAGINNGARVAVGGTVGAGGVITAQQVTPVLPAVGIGEVVVVVTPGARVPVVVEETTEATTVRNHASDVEKALEAAKAAGVRLKIARRSGWLISKC